MMFARRLPLNRGAATRHLLQSKDSCYRRPPSRTFTRNALLQLMSPAGTRARLPFLHPARFSRTVVRGKGLQQQLTRLISTENKVYYKTIFKRFLKYTLIGWAIAGSYMILAGGLQLAVALRKSPPPPEWSFAAKWKWVHAWYFSVPAASIGLVNWVKVLQQYLQTLVRLEDFEGDGKGLTPIALQEQYPGIEDEDMIGYDLTSKSEPWRRGYHVVLMQLAKAVENLHNFVRDTSTGIVFPAESMIGPSNPYPRPLPPYSAPAPLEENCEPSGYKSPKVYYWKILTCHGFTSAQRLEAALGLADWLDAQGESSSAEEIYDWALDIAMGSLPVGVNNVVDIRTGVISQDATYVSSNILKATTALAHFHARHKHLNVALPIFLSILRARRQVLLPELPQQSRENPSSAFGYIMSTLKFLLIPPPYPSPPPTGDEIPHRSPTAVCEEAAVMAHIGEILFAISNEKDANARNKAVPYVSGRYESSEAGLSWTRDAVDLAEETFRAAGPREESQEARSKCMQCLSAGMANWTAMVEQKFAEERAVKASPAKTTPSNVFWGGGRTPSGAEEVAIEHGRWESEARLVERRSGKVKRMIVEEEDRDPPLWMKVIAKG